MQSLLQLCISSHVGRAMFYIHYHVSVRSKVPGAWCKVRKISKNWVVISVFLKWQEPINLAPSMSYNRWCRNQKPSPTSLFVLTGCESRRRGARRICPFSHHHHLILREIQIHSSSQSTFLYIYCSIYRIWSKMHIPHHNLLWKLNNVLKTSFHIVQYSLHHYFHWQYGIPCFI